jgi:FkbM family methyltransferase
MRAYCPGDDARGSGAVDVTLKHRLRRHLWTIGWDVVRFAPGAHPIARRRKLLATYGIGVILDVGANDGQYGATLREDLGFDGYIRSFEPMGAAFSRLEARAARDPRWDVFQLALGDEEGTATINIAGNSYSSSLLDMLPAHAAAAPESRSVGTEEVALTTLDAVFDDACPDAERVFLKIDTQGYEGPVLRGAARSLSRVDVVQLEMSLVPLYAGELSLVELVTYMLGEGFVLVALEPGFTDPRTGELLQVDGIFHRAG